MSEFSKLLYMKILGVEPPHLSPTRQFRAWNFQKILNWGVKNSITISARKRHFGSSFFFSLLPPVSEICRNYWPVPLLTFWLVCSVQNTRTNPYTPTSMGHYGQVPSGSVMNQFGAPPPTYSPVPTSMHHETAPTYGRGEIHKNHW